MGLSDRDLAVVGRRVATLQDAAPEARFDRDQGRARFILASGLPTPPLDPPGRSRAFTGRLWMLVAAVLLSAGLFVLLRPSSRQPSLRFEVADAAPLRIGDWLAATTTPRTVRFSDSSTLLLSPGGQVRVIAVDGNGAEVAVERGSVAARIHHRDRTHWVLRGGPYQVDVVGTEFDLRWDPSAEEFSIAVREGEVAVTGPFVGQRRAVHAKEQLVAASSKGGFELTSTDPIPPPSASLPLAPAPLAPIPATSTSTATPPSVGHKPRAIRPTTDPSEAKDESTTWRSLAAAGRYKDALTAAETEGFDDIIVSLPAKDLRLLGDVARLGGSTPRAAQALHALRDRFPGAPEATVASFVLGRIAQDQGHDYDAAARFFSLYLRESPGGELAPEALGRLMEVEDKRGNEDSARRAAERYLKAHPDGPRATYARRLLGPREDEDL